MFARWVLFLGAVQLAGCAALPRSSEPVGRCSDSLEQVAVEEFEALQKPDKKRGLAFRIALPATAAEATESGHTAIVGFAWVSKEAKDFPIGSVVVTNPATGKAEVLPEVVPAAPPIEHSGVQVQATYVVLPIRLLRSGENVVVRSKSGKEYLYVTIERLRSAMVPGATWLEPIQESSPDPKWMSRKMSQVFCF